MPTTEAEFRIWNRLGVHEKAAAISLFYVASALFPWISITAVFAFLAGRSCGIQVGKLNAAIEHEKTEAMRFRILAELQKQKQQVESLASSCQTYPTLTPIAEEPLVSSMDIATSEEIPEESECAENGEQGEQGEEAEGEEEQGEEEAE